MKFILSLIMIACLGCSQLEINKETRTERLVIVDQGSSIPNVVKIAQNNVAGILIDENGNSSGVIATVEGVEGDILVGPRRYQELIHWESQLSKLLKAHPELKKEVE